MGQLLFLLNHLTSKGSNTKWPSVKPTRGTGGDCGKDRSWVVVAKAQYLLIVALQGGPRAPWAFPFFKQCQNLPG